MYPEVFFDALRVKIRQHGVVRNKAVYGMADKSKTATVDGLNQRFKIRRDSKGRSSVTAMPGTTLANIGDPILSQVNVDAFVDQILQHVAAPGLGAPLEKVARQLGEDFRLDRKIPPSVGAHCAECEFRTTPVQSTLRSGFHECWREAQGLSPQAIEEGAVLDIWNFRGK